MVFLDGRIGVFLDPGLGGYDCVRYQWYMNGEESGTRLLSQRPYSCKEVEPARLRAGRQRAGRVGCFQIHGTREWRGMDVFV